MTGRGILLDCDPGNDDALGILVAAGPGARTLGGDDRRRPPRASARRAMPPSHWRWQAVRDVPVAQGALGPLVRERLIAAVLDLESGLDPERPDLDAVSLDPRRHSADLIAEVLLAGKADTVVTTGPFTNLALAIRRHPECATRIARIVSLAGAWGLGNKTARCRVERALRPGGGGDRAWCGYSADFDPDRRRRGGGHYRGLDRRYRGDRRSGRPLRRGVVALVGEDVRPALFEPAHMPLNDPVAAMVAADPQLASTRPARVEIELRGEHTYGRTVIDFALRSGRAANADVVIGLDGRGVHHAFVAALARLAAANQN